MKLLSSVLCPFNQRNSQNSEMTLLQFAIAHLLNLSRTYRSLSSIKMSICRVVKFEYRTPPITQITTILFHTMTAKDTQQCASSGSDRLSTIQDNRSDLKLLSSSTGSIRTITHLSYAIVSTLCFVMVIWILVFPSSLWYEHSPTHQKLLRAWFYSVSGNRKGKIGAVSSELIAKYTGQYLVQMTHIFPSAIWAAMIPFQLNTKFRKNYSTLHRCIGYGFVGSALSLGTGVFVILYKGLLYENSFADLPPKSFSVAPLLILLTIYFLGTILSALYYAVIARPKSYYTHSVWITRHVASGIWIAVQRILLGTPLFNRPPMTREQQRDAFGNAGFLAMVITIVGGEILIYLWNYERSKSVTAAECKKYR